MGTIKLITKALKAKAENLRFDCSLENKFLAPKTVYQADVKNNTNDEEVLPWSLLNKCT